MCQHPSEKCIGFNLSIRKKYLSNNIEIVFNNNDRQAAHNPDNIHLLESTYTQTPIFPLDPIKCLAYFWMKELT
jgi:hypothetical protein